MEAADYMAEHAETMHEAAQVRDSASEFFLAGCVRVRACVCVCVCVCAVAAPLTHCSWHYPDAAPFF